MITSAAQPSHGGVKIDLGSEHVLAEPAQTGRASSVSTGPFQRTPSSSSPRSTSHGCPVRGLPRRLDPPAPGHPQVAAHDESPFEPEQEMLADGLHRLEHAPVDPLRDTGRLAARVRRLDLEPLPDERLQPPRSAMKRVALGHCGPA